MTPQHVCVFVYKCQIRPAYRGHLKVWRPVSLWIVCLAVWALVRLAVGLGRAPVALAAVWSEATKGRTIG